MKCQNCGAEFSGMFCPSCGAQANNTAPETSNFIPNVPTATQENPPKKNSAMSILSVICDRTNRLFAGSILCVLFALCMGEIAGAIIFIICAVLTSPKVKVKFKNQMVLRIVVIFLAVIAAALIGDV